MCNHLKKILIKGLILAFLANTLGPLPVQAGSTEFTLSKAEGLTTSALLGLPEPGKMVSLSPAYEPAIIKGIKIHKENPFLFDFIVDVGQDKLSGDALKNEGQKLIKYFLAALAILEQDLWVNLSPYEKDRTIPATLSKTEMGRDLLAQDYILKQITASLIYPESGLGKSFWDKVYAKAQAVYGASQIPINTFNKVWIMADKADVFERNQTAFVVGCHLKVMLEEDYLATTKNTVGVGSKPTLIRAGYEPVPTNDVHQSTSQIIREIILPELEHEVNTGKNFANLRQIFNSLILAAWYKKTLKNAVLNKVYANKEKVKGIAMGDVSIKEQIYQRYLQAYKKGVFNYIKEDVVNGQTVPRKYFSGGVVGNMASMAMVSDPITLAAIIPKDRAMMRMTTRLDDGNVDAAMARDVVYDDNRTVISRDGKAITIKDVRKYFEPVAVYYSKKIEALKLEKKDPKSGDILVVKNDSYFYGQREDGKSAARGVPYWLFILKPKHLEGDEVNPFGQDDEIYAGDADVRSTFPKISYATEYSKIEILKENKEIEQTEYKGKVDDLKKLAVLLAGFFPDDLVAQLKKLLGSIDEYRVGDVTYNEIDRVYSLFSVVWTTIEIKEAKIPVSMEHFLSAWNSFNEGLHILNKRNVREAGLAGVLSKADVEAIVALIEKLNNAVNPLIELTTTESFNAQLDALMDRKHSLAHQEYDFVGKLEELYFLYEVALDVQTRLVMDRLARGQGKHRKISEADEIKSPYIHSLRLIAEYLRKKQFAGLKDGESARVLVADAQDGRLEADLKDAQGLHFINMETRLSKSTDTDKVASIQGEIHRINAEGKPVITSHTKKAAVELSSDLRFFRDDFKVHAIVLAHIFNRLKPKEIKDVLRAIMRLLADPVDDKELAPVIYISMPENTVLMRSFLEKILLRLGFTPVAQKEGMKFSFNDGARKKLAEQFGEEMIANRRKDGQELTEADRRLSAADRDLIEERIVDVERFVKKPFQFGVYARTRQPDADIDIDSNIPEVPLEKKKQKGEKTGAANTFLSDLDWNSIEAFAAINPLGAGAVEAADSTEIVLRNDLRVKNLELSLSAVDWFHGLLNNIGLNVIPPVERRKLERAQEIIKLWDGDNVPYLSIQEFNSMVLGFKEGGVTPRKLRDIIPPVMVDVSVARAYGELNLDSHLVADFYRHLEKVSPSGNLYSIEQLYEVFHQLNVNAAMLTSEQVKQSAWAQKIKSLMEKGMPTEDDFFGGITKRERGTLLIQWGLVTGGMSLEQLFKQIVIESMEDKITDALLISPEISKVAHELNKYRYFQAWHDALAKANEHQTLKDSLEAWIAAYFNGKKEDLLIEDDVKTVSQEINDEHEKDLVHAVVSEIKSNGELAPVIAPAKIPEAQTASVNWDQEILYIGQAMEQVRQDPKTKGLVPDVYSVAGVLYNRMDSKFGEWVRRQTKGAVNSGLYQWMKIHDLNITDEQIKERVGIGNLLVTWIKNIDPEVNGSKNSEDEIFDKYKVFVPTNKHIDWRAASKDQVRVTRLSLGGARVALFELELTSMIWFLQNKTDAELKGLESLIKDENTGASKEKRLRAIQRELAEIRFLWDTEQVQYITKKQFDFVGKNATELEMPSLRGGFESIQSLFLHDFYTTKERLNLSEWRPQVERPLVALSAILSHKVGAFASEGSRRVTLEAISDRVDALMEQETGVGIFNLHKYQKLTFSHVATALNYFGIAFTPYELSKWFELPIIKAYGITPKLFSVYETLSPVAEPVAVSMEMIQPAWEAVEGKLKSVVQQIKNNGEGLIPDVEKTAEILYGDTGIPSFKIWMDANKKNDKEKRGRALLQWINLHTPVEKHITQYQLLSVYGIYDPSIDNYEGRRVSKADLGRNLEYYRFEQGLNAFTLLFELMSDEELIRIFESNFKESASSMNPSVSNAKEHVRKLRIITAGLRHSWDSQSNVSLPKGYVDAVMDLGNAPILKYNQITNEEVRGILRRVFLRGLDENQLKKDVSPVRLYLFFLGFLQNLKMNEAQSSVKTTSLRPTNKWRIAMVSALASIRFNAIEVEKNPKEMIDSVSEELGGMVDGIHERILRYGEVARFLNYFGDPVDAVELKRWLESPEVYVKPEIFDIVDDILVSAEPGVGASVAAEEIWKSAQIQIHETVASIKNNGEGLIPDVEKVAEILYADDGIPSFKAWMDENGKNNTEERGNALLEWVNTHFPDDKKIKGYHLLSTYGIFSRPKTPFSGPMLTKDDLSSNKDYQYSELVLTAFAAFFEQLSDEDIYKMIPAGKDKESLMKMFFQLRGDVAAIRFLGDTKNEALLKVMIDNLKGFYNTVNVRYNHFSQDFRDFVYQETARRQGKSLEEISQTDVQSGLSFFLFYYLKYNKEKGGRHQLRPTDKLILSKIALLQNLKIIKGIDEILNEIGDELSGINERFTFGHVAAFFSLVGDKTTAPEIKEWLNSDASYIKPDFFDIVDNAPEASVAPKKFTTGYLQALLDDAKKNIREEGLMPDIYSVGKYLHDHDKDFKKEYEDYRARNQANTLGYEVLSKGIILQLDPGINGEEVYIRHGMYVPSDEVNRHVETSEKIRTGELSIDQLKRRGKPIVLKRLFGVNRNYQEFEGRLTALIMFIQKIGYQRLVTLIGQKEAEDLIKKTVEMQYLCDSRQVLFLYAKDVDWILRISQQKILKIKLLPSELSAPQLNKVLERSPEVKISLVDWWITRVDKNRSPSELRALFNVRSLEKRRFARLSSLVSFGDTKSRDSKKGAVIIVDKVVKPFNMGEVVFRLQAWGDDIKNTEELLEWFKSSAVSSYTTRQFFDINPRDGAMTAEGGINLNTNAMELNVSKEGAGVETKVDQAMIDRVLKEGIESLTPTIFSITEIKSIWLLVGLQPPH